MASPSAHRHGSVTASSPLTMTNSSRTVYQLSECAAEKENDCVRSHASLSPSAQHPVKSKDTRTTSLLSGGKRITTPSASFLSSALGIAKTSSPARVLRLGETIESLCLLRPHSSEAYRRLCMQMLHDAEAAQDAKIWIRVLREVMKQQHQNGQDVDEDSRGKKAIVFCTAWPA